MNENFHASGQGSIATPVPQPPTKEAKAKSQKGDARSPKDNQIILDFLRKCGPYEADALRVMVDYAVCNDANDKLGKLDLLAVNRFLNIDVESVGKEASAISTHRQNRAFTLVDAASPFIEKTQTIKVMRLLISIASDKASVESVMNNFVDFANRK